MVRLGELVVILDLHRQGVSVSAIARRVGIDRKTVCKYIERGLEPPRCRPLPAHGLCAHDAPVSDRQKDWRAGD